MPPADKIYPHNNDVERYEVTDSIRAFVCPCQSAITGCPERLSILGEDSGPSRET